jgi:hypothetical protein
MSRFENLFNSQPSPFPRCASKSDAFLCSPLWSEVVTDSPPVPLRLSIRGRTLRHNLADVALVCLDFCPASKTGTVSESYWSTDSVYRAHIPCGIRFSHREERGFAGCEIGADELRASDLLKIEGMTSDRSQMNRF